MKDAIAMDTGDGRSAVRRTARAAVVASTLPRRARAAGALAMVLLCALSSPTDAKVCWTSGPAQFAEGIQYCVSAVVPSARGTNYGPRNLASGDARAAWCAPAPKTGETVWVELRIDRGAPFRRLLVRNGYGKTAASYHNNSRPKTAAISVDGGTPRRVGLPDNPDLSPIFLSSVGAFHVVRIEFVDIYAGSRSTDVCLGYVAPDFEYEEILNQAGEGPPTSANPGLGALGFPTGLELDLNRR